MNDQPDVTEDPLLAAATALDAAAMALDQLGGWRAAADVRDASLRACRALQASAPADAAIERAALVIPSGPIGKYGDIEAVIADALSHHPANYISGPHTERDVAGWIIAKVREALAAAEEQA